jgi:uncharacterized protein YegP (UPF0339 family)
MAKYRLWQSQADSKWYWDLYSDTNNKIVCWAEGYSTRQAAIDSIDWVRHNALEAPIVPRVINRLYF